VIIHQSYIGSFMFFSKNDPVVDFFHDLFFFYVEVSFYHSFETLAWLLQLLKHRKLHIRITNDVAVTFILLFSFRRSCFIFEPGFIEVDFLAHNDSLGRQKHLQDG